MNIRQAFQIALQHHQSGRLADAEAIYRQILAAEPRHAEALHLLGVIAHQVGRDDAAVELIRQAIAIKADFPEAHYNLGVSLSGIGQLDEALAAYRRAIALKPNYPEAYYNLGCILDGKGRMEEAIAAYRETIALRPNHFQALINLGTALQAKGLLDDAIAAYRQAIALNPNLPAAHCNLGTALKDKGQLDEAIAAYHQAILLKPNDPEARSNLGNALRDKGQLDDAIAAYRQAITINSDYPEAHSNLGLALRDKGQLEEAIASCRHAIALKPDYPEAHQNLALALLLQGGFSEGWEEHEWRWRCKHFSSLRRNFPQPLWDGGPLEGRTILLHAEQGCGDAIQFIRYLPQVIQRGGRVIVECQQELQKLLQTMGADFPVLARGQALPAFDTHCPLMSLPHLFAADLTNIPQTVPYLNANAADVGMWRSRLAGHSSSLKVGLAWAGNPAHKNDRYRSLKLASLAPLADVSSVRFVSLQKGEATVQAKSLPDGMEWIDASQELKDFADTAALIANLDLVIAVDTSVAHLAGAMGKPVWTLLPLVPDWRWLLDRSDSPWYPSMRLFRQRRAMEWEPVIAKVREELHNLSSRPATENAFRP